MGLLLIREANGGLAGSDVRILERTGRTVSVTGIDNHELPGLDIVTGAALLHTNHGKVVLIMHEYAYYGRGNTIHSPGQIEWFQNDTIPTRNGRELGEIWVSKVGTNF